VAVLVAGYVAERQRQRHPTLRERREEWGTREVKKRDQNKSTAWKAEPPAKSPQDEVPEWYYQACPEVRCGNYGLERVGHPPGNSSCPK